MHLLKRSLAAFAILAAAACGASPPAADETEGAENGAVAVNADFEAIAHGLVTRAANVREGDKVLITGNPRDQELLENVVTHVRKLGAHPLLITGTERLALRSYDDVSERFDSVEDPWSRTFADMADVWISFSAIETPDLLAHVPPERFAARAEAQADINNTIQRRNVRLVEVGNGLYPTAYTAGTHGLQQGELARIFWAGMDADAAALDAAGARVKAALANGRQARITGANGTDLTFELMGGKALINDGAISAADEAEGGASVAVYLPAGEVYTAARAGTATGTVVVPRMQYQGKEFENVRLTFANGSLTAMEGPDGFEVVQARYDAAPAGKELFGGVDVGINPGVPADKVLGWMPAGMITVGIGNNMWAGGDNDINFSVWFFLPGMTLSVDDQVIVEDGVLKG